MPSRDRPPLQPFKAILFDLDGTLVDSIPFLVDCFRGASRAVLEIDPTPDAVRRMVGLPLRTMFTSLSPDLSDDVADRCIDAYRDLYHPDCSSRSPLFPDARSVVEELSYDGVALGIVTGKTLVGLQRILEPLDMLTHFGALIGADHGGRPKPAPDGALRAANDLGIPPAEILVVGDSLLDMEMGLAAGMTVCAVTTGTYSRSELEPRAHFVIESLADLPKAIREFHEARSIT